jgi:putative transposase
MKISRRRVQQIWESLNEQNQEPKISQNMGRLGKLFDDQEAQVIAEAFGLYRFGARMLEVIIRKVFKKRISHNRIHMYLKVADLAHEDPRKKEASQVGSMSESIACLQNISIGMNPGWSDLKVCVIIDDAPRMILAGGEIKNVNTKNSKLVVDQLVERYWWLCPMREPIMDQGAEFGAHRVYERWQMERRFRDAP